jgi:hypothetical protein
MFLSWSDVCTRVVFILLRVIGDESKDPEMMRNKDPETKTADTLNVLVLYARGRLPSPGFTTLLKRNRTVCRPLLFIKCCASS